jgi:hypothetical protein
MKLNLIKQFLLIFIGITSFGTASAEDIPLECPKMSNFILEQYDDVSELVPLQNSVTYPIKKEQGGGWVIRMLYAKDSPWNFGDIVIQTEGITDGKTAWTRAKQIKHASLHSAPVLRKHFFNKDRTGSYFYTCSYPIGAQYAISGDSITVSSTIYTDGIGTSKESNGTESIIYDYFSHQCGDEDLCMLQ